MEIPWNATELKFNNSVSGTAPKDSAPEGLGFGGKC